MYVGVELCDDVADGDISGGPAAEAQATLLSGTVLASIAPQAVASLFSAPDGLEALNYLWRGLQAMSGGQRRDLALYGESHPDPLEVEAALAKSTAECGMYAALGASVAGGSGDVLVAWERFGAQLGYALKVNADCRDAFEPTGRDIESGARTLPIALALQRDAHGDVERLRADLARAPHDIAACARARDAIISSGSMVACGALVQAAITRAERILDMLAPQHDTALRLFLPEMSFMRSQ